MYGNLEKYCYECWATAGRLVLPIMTLSKCCSLSNYPRSLYYYFFFQILVLRLYFNGGADILWSRCVAIITPVIQWKKSRHVCLFSSTLTKYKGDPRVNRIEEISSLFNLIKKRFQIGLWILLNWQHVFKDIVNRMSYKLFYKTFRFSTNPHSFPLLKVLPLCLSHLIILHGFFPFLQNRFSFL